MTAKLEKNIINKIFRENNSYIGIKSFVETGTFLGETVVNMAEIFPICHTIEIDEKKYLKTKDTLDARGIKSYLGDSSDILPVLCVEIKEPVLFFLDAHYDGFNQVRIAKKDVCLYEELYAISERRYADIVIIDDVRLFGQRFRESIWGELSPDWTDISIDSIVRMMKRRLIKLSIENDQLILFLK